MLFIFQKYLAHNRQAEISEQSTMIPCKFDTEDNYHYEELPFTYSIALKNIVYLRADKLLQIALLIFDTKIYFQEARATAIQFELRIIPNHSSRDMRWTWFIVWILDLGNFYEALHFEEWYENWYSSTVYGQEKLKMIAQNYMD